MNLAAGYKKIPVKTWFLTFEGIIPEVASGEDSIHILRWKNPPVDEYLKIYTEIGSIWGWTGRLLIPQEELNEILQSENNQVWLFQVNNQLAGFFELVQTDHETEIVYLGLKPEWIGKGLGQKLIQTSVAVAGRDNRKVWLHTCERDHPTALLAYQKAGFKIEKELITQEYYPEL